MTTPLKKHSHGQALIEFALLLPIFLLIVMVTLDLGRAVYYYSVVYNAAREGARYGTVYPYDQTGIENAAMVLTIGLDPAEVDIDVPVPALSDMNITVTVSYDYHAVTPFVPLILGSDTLTLTSTASMIIER